MGSGAVALCIVLKKICETESFANFFQMQEGLSLLYEMCFDHRINNPDSIFSHASALCSNSNGQILDHTIRTNTAELHAEHRALLAGADQWREK
jgi:hypothetical protein